jgi:hypothetical protein
MSLLHESIHICLNRLKKVSDFVWIDLWPFESIHLSRLKDSVIRITKCFWLALNRFKLFWIVSIFILDSLNRFNSLSIFTRFFFPVLSFSGLNRFIHLVNPFMLLFLTLNFELPLLHYINSPPHNFQFIESFASILSWSEKLFVHKFFKIKHFFLESLWTLSRIDFLGF